MEHEIAIQAVVQNGRRVDLPRSSPVVIAELERVEISGNQLHEMLEELRTLLEPVLAPEPPLAAAMASGTTHAPEHSEVTNRLTGHGHALDLFKEDLRRLMDRVEL